MDVSILVQSKQNALEQLANKTFIHFPIGFQIIFCHVRKRISIDSKHETELRNIME